MKPAGVTLIVSNTEPAWPELEADAPTPRCAAQWPICPSCAVPLWSSAGSVRCSLCSYRATDQDRDPCPDPGSVAVRDLDGGYHGALCVAHAACALEQLVGARLAEGHQIVPRSKMVLILASKLVGEVPTAIPGRPRPGSASPEVWPGEGTSPAGPMERAK